MCILDAMRQKRRATRSKLVLLLLLLVLLLATLFFWLKPKAALAPGPETTGSTKKTTQTTPPSFNKKLYSTDTPGSIWWVVNKKRPLNPVNYAPPDLVTPNVPLRLSAANSEMHVSGQMAPALEQLFAAAKKDGVNLMLASGYRSYQLQVAVYNQNVAQLGQAGADEVSAHPGTSEHQTGLAADLEPTSRKCEIDVCFADTPEGKWLVANSYKYGFIIRYQKDKESVTGYNYEPWHVRYIGTDLSMEMHKEGITTLEEFFGL